MTNRGSRKVTVVGAGGQATVVVATLVDAGYAVDRVVDDDKAKRGCVVLGVPVEGPIDVSGLRNTLAILAVGSNAGRETLARRIDGVEWLTLVHPSAYVHPSASIGPGTVVFAGSVIQPNARIGSHAIINTGTTVDHDCVIDDFVHLAPGTHLAGNVRIGTGAFLGIGSCVTPSISVGPRAMVGAGAVVISDLPAGVTAVGVPARPTEARA